MNHRTILKKELEKVKLSDEEYASLNKTADIVIKALENKIKKKGIGAKVFIGGSLAKKTLIKKPKYDIDIFVRFNKKYSEEEIKKNMKKIFFLFSIPKYRKKVKKIHGSRDYYKIKLKSMPRVSFEIVPVVEIKKPEEARNITDLSYFHVDYVGKESSKNKKLIDEIILAKSFCYAQESYGAESYIKGFSGYCLELLIIHYKSFMKFIKEIAKAEEKIIIDSAKYYKNKNAILKELNKSKLLSPIVVIDPTFKARNASGALSHETFNKFKVSCRGFLEHPSEIFFDYKNSRPEELKEMAERLDGIYAVLEVKTKKQEGDIAGSKLLKFSKVLTRDIGKYFSIIDSYFDYNSGKTANIYYVLQNKKEIINEGPSLHYEKAVKGFKEKHPIWYIENGKIKSAHPSDISLKEFIKMFKRAHKKTLREMRITKVKII